MTEEAEEGPDPNDVRRHAKKMLTEKQYREKYCRLDFYRPNDKQREFHNLTCPEAMLRAGNQLGKTQAAGAQMAMDALGRYPDNWGDGPGYEGRRFLVPPKIERPFDFMGWYACTTSGKTRDGAQMKLLGEIRAAGGLGTGMIPLDSIIGRPTMARGISDFVDSFTVMRDTGGKAMLRGKTYEMGREAYQGEPVDVMWNDEDISRDDSSIYGEELARLTTTNGRIINSMSPLLGMSPLRKRFKERQASGECREVLMTIYDCAVSKGGHIPDDDIPKIIARYSDSERATRAFGADMQGEGAVFMTPIERVKHSRDPAEFPPYWPWLWGVDFSHGGLSESSHPFAAVLGAWDRDNDIIYIVHAVRMAKALSVNHVDRMKQNPNWLAPVSWPHDGGTHTAAGITIAATYKKLGLNMLPKHATFPDGGYDFENGIKQMEERFASGRLLIARHLAEYFDEYLGYHRIDGLVNKVDDDLLSATRQLVMGLRNAKTQEAVQQRFARPGTAAPSQDFDLFTGA